MASCDESHREAQSKRAEELQAREASSRDCHDLLDFVISAFASF